jgi:hypothetical protein
MCADLLAFVSLCNPFLSIDVHPLFDMFGPSTVIPSLTAIVVSQETADGGTKVNAERQRKGLSLLEVIVVGLVGASAVQAPSAAAAAAGAAASAAAAAPSAAAPSSTASAAVKGPAVSAVTGLHKIGSTDIRQQLIARQAEQLTRLRADWRSLLGAGGGADASGSAEAAAAAVLAERWWERLRTAYSEPQRAYHTLSHIDALLALVRDRRAELKSPEAVSFAVWFHDIVYDPTAHDNEDRSAKLWADFAAESKHVVPQPTPSRPARPGSALTRVRCRVCRAPKWSKPYRRT